MVARKQYPLRIDPALWAELEAWAADELRSVNGQIEFILRRAVAERKRRLRHAEESHAQLPCGGEAACETPRANDGQETQEEG